MPEQRFTLKHRQIMAHLKWDNYKKELWDMYHNKYMSGVEISEYINQNMPQGLGVTISPRSVQRVISNHGKAHGILKPMRDKKESFNLAIKRGRVNWKYKEFKYRRKTLNKALRYSILKRDGYKCTLCGNTAENALLEVDHIKPLCDGGLSTLDNMRTTCHLCNKGKQIHERERYE